MKVSIEVNREDAEFIISVLEQGLDDQPDHILRRVDEIKAEWMQKIQEWYDHFNQAEKDRRGRRKISP
jgi:hypothetical protein